MIIDMIKYHVPKEFAPNCVIAKNPLVDDKGELTFYKDFIIYFLVNPPKGYYPLCAESSLSKDFYENCYIDEDDAISEIIKCEDEIESIKGRIEKITMEAHLENIDLNTERLKR